VATHSAAFFERVWNRFNSQGTTEFVPVVDIILVGPIKVVKFLLDGGIEFVASIFLVLLAEAFEFGSGRFRRSKLELGVLREKPLKWCCAAWWAVDSVLV